MAAILSAEMNGTLLMSAAALLPSFRRLPAVSAQRLGNRPVAASLVLPFSIFSLTALWQAVPNFPRIASISGPKAPPFGLFRSS